MQAQKYVLNEAESEARWNDLKRLHSESKSFHADTELMTPEQIVAEKHPLLNPKPRNTSG